eukprot:UN09418
MICYFLTIKLGYHICIYKTLCFEIIIIVLGFQ